QVLSEEHRAHAALAHQALELVLALDDALQAGHEALDLPAGRGIRTPARLIRPAREAELAVVGQRRVALDAVDRRAHGRRRIGRRPMRRAGGVVTARRSGGGSRSTDGAIEAISAAPGGAHEIPGPPCWMQTE